MELDDGADVDARDAAGNTLLLLAARQGHKRAVKLLLRRGATLNAQNRDGNAALHFCHAHGHAELAAYLRSKGADDALLNAQGLTCYEGLTMHELERL
ncbi:ankyrin repeat-containing domain protein [Tribonema minus]|uniref:Ankyrin repeat-containing domain protein n=1 Tax=Tribonema minus TaxID=303371 RepID=A0A835ZHE6_9STRA|nr:ankyrin repeat-containing domain protein [Tribonema minus]